MTWTRTSDDYADDCWTLSDAAYRLHHEGLTWSNRKLLDCVIPLDDLRRFARCPDAVDELLDRKFWTVSEDGAAYVIRHHAGYQRTREQVLKQQQANSANGSRGGRPRKGVGAAREVWETDSVTETLSESRSQGDGTGLDWKGSPRTPPTNVGAA